MKVSQRGRAVRYYYGYWAINSGDMMMMLARCKQSAAVWRKLSIELSKTFSKLSALLVGGGVCVLGRAGKCFLVAYCCERIMLPDLCLTMELNYLQKNLTCKLTRFQKRRVSGTYLSYLELILLR